MTAPATLTDDECIAGRQVLPYSPLPRLLSPQEALRRLPS